MNSIWSDIARMIYHVEVEVEPSDLAASPFAQPAGGTATRAGSITYSGGSGAESVGALAAATAGGGMLTIEDGYEEEELVMPVVEQRKVADEEQIGRNDPCWCGSGKKYKKCHGA